MRRYMMKKKKLLLITFATSVFLYLCVFWVNYFQNLYLSAWVHSLAFISLTWLWLSKKGKEAGMTSIVGAIILGRIILEIPVRSLDFTGTMSTLMLPVSSMLSILLISLCFYKRNIGVYTLSIILIILANTILQTIWDSLFKF
jgi:hypothetical protein